MSYFVKSKNSSLLFFYFYFSSIYLTGVWIVSFLRKCSFISILPDLEEFTFKYESSSDKILQLHGCCEINKYLSSSLLVVNVWHTQWISRLTGLFFLEFQIRESGGGLFSVPHVIQSVNQCVFETQKRWRVTLYLHCFLSRECCVSESVFADHR